MSRRSLRPSLRLAAVLFAVVANASFAATAVAELSPATAAPPAAVAPVASSGAPAIAPAPAATTAPAVAPAAASAVAATQAANPEEDWIRPEDVADRADQLTRRLESRITTDSAKSTVEKIDAAMTRLDHDLSEAFDQAKAALSGSGSLLTIQDARRELEGASTPFQGWRDQLDAEARRVSDVLDELEVAEKRWARTLVRPETLAAGDVIVRRVRSSVEQISAAKAELSTWRQRVLALSDRLLDRTNAVTGTLEKLDTATRTEGASVLFPEQKPIWQRDIAARLSAELPLVPVRLSEFTRSTTQYFATDARPFLLQILLWLGLMFAMRGLPEGSKRRAEMEHVSVESLRLLARPFAIAGLLVLSLSPRMHPTAPHRVMQVFGLIALIPVARILMLANARSNLSLYLGLFTLLLLDRFSIALASLPAVTLLLFFVSLGIAVTLGLEYRRRLQAANGNAWVIEGINIVLVGIGIAVVAEIGGWSALATLVGRGSLVAATVALYTYAITLSLEALFAYTLASPMLRSSRFVDRNQEMVQRWTSRSLRLLGVLYWLNLVVNALGVRDILGDLFRSVMSAGITVGALSISLGGVLAFVMTLLLAFVVSRIVHEILEDEVFPRINLPRGIPNALLSLSSYAVWSFGFLLALAAAGVQMSQLAILMGGLGVGIGLGLQDVVKNFAAGITLLFERRLHVGDAVQIPDKNVFGRIISIGMRASVVRNWNGTEAIMPNDDLVSGTVTNWTLSDELHRVEVQVGVAYGNEPTKIIELLLAVAESDSRLLRTPPPTAFFTAFGESSLDFVLRAWSGEAYETAAQRSSELAVAVHAALKAAGIEIPFPRRDVTIVEVTPEASAALRPEHAG